MKYKIGTVIKEKSKYPGRMEEDSKVINILVEKGILEIKETEFSIGTQIEYIFNFDKLKNG